MHYFSLIFLCCLAGVSYGLNPQGHQNENVCLYDKQCSMQYGNSCICYKGIGNDYYGKCYCLADLGCSKHEDCRGKGKPNQICRCLNNKARGECSCYDPLYAPRS